MTTYVGIDQSLSNFAAVALVNDEVEILLIQSKQRGVRRLHQIRLEVIQWLSTLPMVDHVCMEGYANGSKFSRESMGEIGGITKLALLEYFGQHKAVAYPTIAQPLQVKQFAGDVKAKKEDLKLLTYKKWGFEHPSNDVVDAYILAKIAKAMEEGGDLIYEKKIVEKLRASNEF